MAYFRCTGGNGGGGGTGETGSLVLEAYATFYEDNTFPRTAWTKNTYDSGCFSYSNYNWVAAKDFTALVVLIHYQYQDASSNNSYSKLSINRNLINGFNFDALQLCPSSPDRFTGSYGIEYAHLKIKQGDKIGEGKPHNYGYENPYVYIFEVPTEDAVTDLENGQNVSFTTGTDGYRIIQNYFNIT